MPERGRNPLLPFLMSICLIAISIDFFDIVRPNPLLSVDAFTGFRVDGSLRESMVSVNCPLASGRLPEDSETLPLAITGDDGLLALGVFDVGSAFPLAARLAPDLDLPADSGLSGNVVRRLGGVSRGKSGSMTGCGGGRILGPGELGRETEVTLRPLLVRLRPPGVKGTDTGDKDGAEFRRVGVDGLDVVRGEGELKFADICDLEVGVEGLEFWDGLCLSTEDVLIEGRGLEGVVDLDTEGWLEGVEDLVIDGERLVGVDDRM